MSIVQTARLGLYRWTSGGDHPPTRAQMDSDVDNLEAKVMIYSEGPESALPASITNGGQIYYATDTNVFYFDYGTGWDVIGRVVKGTVKNVAQTGQTANMEEWRDASNNVVAWVDSAGKFHGHITDTTAWSSPAAVFQSNWANASGYYYGLTQHLSGETAQVRGQVVLNSAGALLTRVDAPYIPLNTQRFPVWVSSDGAWDHGSWSAVAQLIGYRDAAGLTAGNVYIYPAGGLIGNIANGSVLDLNMVYTVGSPGITTP